MWVLAASKGLGEIADDLFKAGAALGLAATGFFAYLNHRSLRPVNGTKGEAQREKRLRKGKPNIADVMVATAEKIDAVVAETQGMAAKREAQAHEERVAILAALGRIEEAVRTK